MSKYAPGEDDLYMRTLELGQVQDCLLYTSRPTFSYRTCMDFPQVAQ